MDQQMMCELNNGVKIPMIGLGVFQTEDGNQTVDAVRWAIEAGYRHIDTAKIYGNEASVGRGIKESGAKRSDLFITTKLWNEDIRQRRTKEAFDESLKAMQLDYVDLYLIHWPAEGYAEAWKAMEEIYATGKARAIGVSNFHAHHLDTILKDAKVVPAVDQIECHPRLTQEPLRRYLAEKKIAAQAWSPLGGTGGSLLKNETLVALAAKHGKTPAQIVLRWDIQGGLITIPKSVHKDRIESNLQIFDFTLDDADMETISKLNQNQRVGSDPDHFDF